MAANLRRKFLQAIPTALTQSLKAWDLRPLAYERNLSRSPLRALRIVIGALWHTKGIYSEIIKSLAKILCAENLCKRFPRRSLRALRLGIGALWHAESIYLEMIKIECKNFLRRKFLKAIPTALTQSLKAWDLRPLVYERSLFRN